MNAVVEQNTKTKAALVSGAAVAGIVPTTIEEVFRLAGAVHAAGLAPYGLETPEKLTIAIMTGLEVGLPPMQAVQSIAVINNRPTIWGDGLIAVVRKSPLCRFVKEWIDGEGDGMVAHCETMRAGEDEPVRRSFAVTDARKAGLWQTEAKVTKQGKNGPYTKDNDSPWYRYPKRMLQMRARALCLRDVYPDVLRGLQVREEVEDYAPRDVTPPANQPRQIDTIAARLPGNAAPQIEAHVAREIDGEGFGEAPSDEDETYPDGDREFDSATNDQSSHPGPADEGGEVRPSSLSPDLIEKLTAYGKALWRASGPDGLRNQDAQFWAPEDGAPDEIKAPAKSIYRAHSFRVDGKWQDEVVTAEIDRVIRKAVGNG